jgi:L-threonylcarbamoyladenylate synthase
MQDYRIDIKQAIEVLKRGGVILYPTDTVWGIGCDATRSDAVKKVFEIKRRADSKALITLMSNTAMLERYVDDVPDVAFELIDVATTPLTIVYDKGINLAPELLADDGSIGVRISTERFSSSLCREFRRPIVSTSANISGQPTPRTFTEISDEIKAAVDYVCTSRQEETDDSHKPSSVIKLSNNGQIKILRK